MQVSAVAAQTTNLDPAVRLPAATDRPVATPIGGDSVGALLAQLATPQIVGLIAHEPPPNVELRREAISALAANDVPRALSLIGELAARHPHELDSVRHEAAFAPVRGEVEQIFQHHIAFARADAQHKISTAMHLYEAGVPRSSRAADIDPQQLISVAHELLSTDRYANIVLAGNLGQSVTDYYGGMRARREISGSEKTSVLYSGLIEMLIELAQRVPLKIQVLVWFAIGLMSGLLSVLLRLFEVEVFSAALPLEIWGAGSLGLIGFGTYRRVQRRRVGLKT